MDCRLHKECIRDNISVVVQALWGKVCGVTMKSKATPFVRLVHVATCHLPKVLVLFLSGSVYGFQDTCLMKKYSDEKIEANVLLFCNNVFAPCHDGTE